MPSIPGLIQRSRAHFAQRRKAARFEADVVADPRPDLIEVGDLGYGGYLLPAALLGPESVCYLAGTGEDISFDLGVIARFGCRVYSMDPVPRAAEHVRMAAAHEPRLTFLPLALWSEDGTLTFHAPREHGYVSQSAVNLHDTTPDFEAPARSVSSLMRQLGHNQIDLLKISAEGSEYEILHHVVSDAIDVRVLCVEYAQPAPLQRVRESVDALRRAGYVLVAASVRTWNWKLTFVGPRVASVEAPSQPAGARPGVLQGPRGAFLGLTG